jgi:stage II sporulation protein D (peptidoglycan lytic transglycosylase)
MLDRTHRIPPHSFRLLVGIWLLVATCGCAMPRPVQAQTVPIRVLLLQNLSTFQVSVPPEYTILTRPASPPTVDHQGWRTLHAAAQRGQIHLSNLGIAVEAVQIVPRRPAAVIYAGDKLYRGGLEVKSRNGKLMVVNTLDLEEYLYGVVPKEAPAKWEMAALRAQAIVARTYALYKRARNGAGDYDVAAQYVRDQHYDGFSAEHPRTTQAVNDTRGLVLTCDGELIPTYYHAESAGSTENSEHVWSAAHPCLRAVKTPMHPASPYLQWTADVALQDVRAALIKSGYAIDTVRSLQPIQWSPSGRIMALKVIHKRGEHVIRGTDFRMALGPEVIRSTRFTVQVRHGRAFFAGQGWGHGVGLCQWCSQGMAELGYDYEAILSHYYQGAKLRYYQ